jgi:hypothetical protein
MRKGFAVAAIVAALFMAGHAQADEVLKFALGANGVWYDNETSPADLEVGGNARAAFSPHIAAVGAAYYGLDKSYLRGSAGVRFTVTDVQNPNFSIGVGVQYHASSDPNVRPEQWCPDVSVGWRAWPEQLPKVLLTGQASAAATSWGTNMTIVQWLEVLAGPGAPLVALLRKVAEELPDLAPAIQEWIAKLESIPAAGNLAEVGAAIPRELLNIASGKLEPTNRPSDLA